MNKLLVIDGDNAQLTAEALDKLVHYERILKRWKAEHEEFKKKLLEEMEKADILKIENDKVVITRIAATTRESLDTKTLRAELPDIYDSYVKISDVKPSIRLKLKE